MQPQAFLVAGTGKGSYPLSCADLGGFDHDLIMNKPLTPVGGLSFTGGLEQVYLLPKMPDSSVVASTEEAVYISFRFETPDFWEGRILAEQLTIWVADFLADQSGPNDVLVEVNPNG